MYLKYKYRATVGRWGVTYTASEVDSGDNRYIYYVVACYCFSLRDIFCWGRMQVKLTDCLATYCRETIVMLITSLYRNACLIFHFFFKKIAFWRLSVSSLCI